MSYSAGSSAFYRTRSNRKMQPRQHASVHFSVKSQHIWCWGPGLNVHAATRSGAAFRTSQHRSLNICAAYYRSRGAHASHKLPPAPPTVITQLPRQFDAWRSNGMLLVDKPEGWDTLDVIAALQQAGGVKPLAHGGRLDVSSSGLVLVCAGEATRTAPLLMQLSKCFEGVIRLGASTRTYDAQGPLWEQMDWQYIDGQQLASVAAALTGELGLLPPPSLAYKLGKQMVTRMEEEHPVEEPRDAMVYSLQLWHPAWPLHAQMHSSPAPTDMQANVGVGHSRDSYSPHSGILISRTHQSYPSRPAPVMQVSSRPCLVQPPTQPGCEIPFSSPAAVQAGLPLPSPELHFRLHTGARAMVRSLVHELGIRLGTRAHLLRARRISIGEHTVQDAWPMETLVPLLQRSKRGLEVAVKRARNSTEYR